MSSTLPPPRENQTFFTVSALEAGILSFPRDLFLAGTPSHIPERWDAPALCFLLRHSATGEYILFDNGIRKDVHRLPPAAQRRVDIFGSFVIVHDAAERVASGGLDPARVSQLVISHAHWDHIGDLSRFPHARIVVSSGTYELSRSGYPADPKSPFAQDLFSPERTRVLDPFDGTWAALGPFDRALDLLGDGSAYVVDAPGHVRGHINLLVRTSADGAWAVLAGDAAHDWQLLTGAATIAVHPAHGCVHVDRELAEAYIEILRALALAPDSRVRVLLAHNAQMWEDARANDWEGFWPKTITSL
ncbi:Metallo-hydrolase/oxidoreductase [Vararia minispora EC-137]|uniref:Metallo-hydrolase/oxidoreductase n=1 Tax=Vararia minispora EC-137 TaxID=1314806 RepID=A0ACB8Q8L1_9AGAM|nr:Metallo-hydrolase/oxidoreductase [Vararia minispora EC-137]